jgi:hypothetical protein
LKVLVVVFHEKRQSQIDEKQSIRKMLDLDIERLALPSEIYRRHFYDSASRDIWLPIANAYAKVFDGYQHNQKKQHTHRLFRSLARRTNITLVLNVFGKKRIRVAKAFQLSISM